MQGKWNIYCAANDLKLGRSGGNAAALGEALTEHLATRDDLRLLQWMVGFNLAFSATILWCILDLA